MAQISRRASRRDRAQLFLVTAIGLAVTFVALALILNTAIFTENLATRGSDTAGASDAGQYRTAAIDGVERILTHANTHNNSSYTALYSNVSTGITYWSNSSARLYAVEGRSVNISGDTTNGTRIIQDEARNFTNKDDADDWDLATDVEHTRGFWVNVTQSSLNDSTESSVGTDNPFHITFDDGTDQWLVYIYQDDPGEVNVTVDGPTGKDSCAAAGTTVTVNITAGTIGGTPCQALDFFPDINPPYTISYHDATFVAGTGGDTATGTYELIVDDTTIPATNFHDDDAGESPYTTPAIYAVTLDIRYETPDLSYNSSARIAPGEPA